MMNPVELLRAEAATCTRCLAAELLYADRDRRAYPLFQNDAPWPARIVAVAEAPNFDDSFDPKKRRLTVEPDTDPSGAFAWELLASVGLRSDEVLFTNSVLCLPKRSGEGKHPVYAQQQDLCAEWLGRFIDAADPLVIITFGAVALQGLGRLERHGLTLRGAAGKLRSWRGRHLLPLYHPGRLGRVTRSAEMQRADISVLRDFLARAATLDPSTAQAIMRLHPEGARLVLRTRDGEVYGDIACSIGFQWKRTPVFAYLPAGSGPPVSNGMKFYVERVTTRGDVAVVYCRHERGIREIEIHALTSDERASVRQWVGSLPADVQDDLENEMRSMLDPRAL